MRFLVTGPSGFIGCRLVHTLAERFGKDNIQILLPAFAQHHKDSDRRIGLVESHFSTVIHDLLQEELDIALIEPFDVLFHLAAFTATETDSCQVHVNDVGTERLLSQLADRLSGTRVVYTGSLASVDRSYPDNCLQAEDYPCAPRTIYGETKLRAEMILQDYAERFGFEWTILRLPTVYGPGFRPGGMFDVIVEDLRRGSLAARLAWPGRMSLVYVEDAVDALIALSDEAAARNALYHISSGENPTLDSLIGHIASLLGLNRRRISPPGWFWRLVRRIIWMPVLMRILPFKQRIAVWRMSLVIIDGMVADSAKLNQVVPLDYTYLSEGLRRTYCDDDSSTARPQLAKDWS